MVDRIWREKTAKAVNTTPFEASAESQLFFDRLQDLAPQNDVERIFQTRAIQIGINGMAQPASVETDILIFILIYNYNRNSAGMVSILNDAVAQTSQAGVERAQDLIESTEGPLRFRHI